MTDLLKQKDAAEIKLTSLRNKAGHRQAYMTDLNADDDDILSLVHSSYSIQKAPSALNQSNNSYLMSTQRKVKIGN